VSSDCRCCDDNGAIIERPKSERRTEAQIAEYDEAVRTLAKHDGFINFLRRLQRSFEAQSLRDHNSKCRDGFAHSIMDKAANSSTAVPFEHVGVGKSKNKTQVALASMTHLFFGQGLVLVLGLPWLKTKANFNLTCYLISFQIVYDKMGYLPGHFSTFFDRGDENVTKYALVFFRTDGLCGGHRNFALIIQSCGSFAQLRCAPWSLLCVCFVVFAAHHTPFPLHR